jgi:hypothetical protein
MKGESELLLQYVFYGWYCGGVGADAGF